MTAISRIQCASYYISNKPKNLQNVFIYKNPETLQEARQFPLRFYTQKVGHFTLDNFS